MGKVSSKSLGEIDHKLRRKTLELVFKLPVFLIGDSRQVMPTMLLTSRYLLK